jgi:hypothetical protein
MHLDPLQVKSFENMIFLLFSFIFKKYDAPAGVVATRSTPMAM